MVNVNPSCGKSTLVPSISTTLYFAGKLLNAAILVPCCHWWNLNMICTFPFVVGVHVLL